MNPTKAKQLQQAFDDYINLIAYDFPIERMSDFVVEDLKGFGSTLDEKFLDIGRFRQMVIDQREQGAGIEIEFLRKPIHRRISPDEDAAIYTDEFEISMNLDGSRQVIPLRLTSVFEFDGNTWKVAHVHGSKAVETEGDTWHKDELKKKNEELQRLVDEKTAELQRQNRELEIEAALERVRARTMAMQKSEELSDAAFLMAKQVRDLGIKAWGCAFHIYADDEEGDYEWFSNEKGYLPFYKTPRESFFKEYFDHRNSGEKLYVKEFNGEECAAHYEYLLSLPALGDALRDLKKAGISLPDSQIDHVAYFEIGHLLFITYEHDKSAHDIFIRFAKEFKQTYTRFLDLQRAEKQAREAQIEASLERVRAKAMAMRNSEDISDATAIVFNELGRLGIKMERCGIATHVKGSVFDIWSTPLSPESQQVLDVINGQLDFSFHPMIAGSMESWQQQQAFYSYEMVGNDQIRSYYHLLEQQSEYRFPLVENYPERQIINTFNFSEGMLFAYTLKPISQEELTIFLRFTKVFSLTFRRYQDLIKAEAQTREAQIEAALERVRSRTMSMRKSNELQEVVTTVADRLNDLGIIVDAGGVIICTYFPDSKDVRHWIAAPDFSYSGSYLLPYFDHVIFEDSWSSKLRGDEFFSKAYSVAEKNSFFEYAFENSDYRYFPEEFKQWMFVQKHHTLSFAWSKNSALLIPSHTGYVPTDSEKEVLKRFAQVFEQAYIRFLDIQKAEIQAKEALRQASLDRIRGEIASMRTSEDLNRITPVIWRELKALEVPFIRCGVFIINENKQKLEVYLSTPEGKALAVLNLAFDANELTRNTLEHWRDKLIFHTHWNREQFVEWTRSMMEIGQIETAESYQGAASAPESLDLHFVPFKQGMLYVGNREHLSIENIELVKTLSEAFSIAYARYEDFKQLEEAKNKIEITLNELKAAQSQLVQSEKMASLGELTAGIAHEIQNPLNFVNNFSEVSTELLEELQEEIENGEMEEVKAIIEDVVKNLEKINHHGKRAESIVKGMLQHSRAGSGKKEPTDINKLADEYLRLSYHGLRAKDKSFNAEFELEADNSIPNIEIVPQDIGRVLLNLINNAFYAVAEKSKLHFADYQPQVIVRTKHKADKIEISVMDNGPGIPEMVKEKIFHPFFTTKPTGQGTGLGLSLSYDIVKAHGGEIEVESVESVGTTFRITLNTPVA
ncbi:ATP-binding protein [Mangrovibacterium diazotrophicum]|uniref:histidine kinase n=1 Tax=Mangrovibacterium diazotrophicum TaxID=1261403 RepID=A0A419W437_9BACT|nr:ATP-binding protein [Mangrovibacterium diazotrophicum]RKD90221.1 phospho-acceptor domain-containing protein [Mangrovibacterium diazotrophicum]